MDGHEFGKTRSSNSSRSVSNFAQFYLTYALKNSSVAKRRVAKSSSSIMPSLHAVLGYPAVQLNGFPFISSHWSKRGWLMMDENSNEPPSFQAGDVVLTAYGVWVIVSGKRMISIVRLWRIPGRSMGSTRTFAAICRKSFHTVPYP
jgi:hypothetical protein